MKRNRIIALILALIAIPASVHSINRLRASASGLKTPAQSDFEARAFLARSTTARTSGRGNPWINFQDGHSIPAEYQGSAKLVELMKENQSRPISLASSDFDEDGVADIATGHSGAQEGAISIQRGDADTIYPNTLEAIAHRSQMRSLANAGSPSSDLQSPFFPAARVFDVASAPEFLAAGDFDGDGHSDLISAAAGSSEFFLLSGDGRGGFAQARSIALPGKLTALIAGDANRMDGMPDLIIAVNAAAGSNLLVYESGSGAAGSEPEIINLPRESKAIAIGQLDNESPFDIAVAAGRELLIIHGRDRSPSFVEGKRLSSEAPAITRVAVSFSIASLAVGDFAGDLRQEIALLSNDGACRIFQRDAQAQSVRWHEASATVLPGMRKGQLDSAARSLITARVSSSPKDDIIFLDQSSNRLSILINESATVIEGLAAGAGASSRLMLAGAVDTDGAPVAALGMRLNSDAANDIILLKSNGSEPTILMSSPLAIFTVSNTNDSGANSLRQAILSANSNPGADSISFNIPGGANQTINLLTPLPTISGPVTLDGTTQSPGNATPPIQLVGTSAGSATKGLTISAGSSTVRGLTINQFDGIGIELIGSGNDIIEGNFIGTNAAGTASLGNGDTGILINTGNGHRIGGTTAAARNVISGNVSQGILVIGPATSNQVQGNFIGTNAAGTSGIGNSSDGVGMLSGATNVTNCTIGGTTAGAGNVISANSGAGVQLIGVGTNNLVQGNLIGTDVTGTIDLGNGFSGVAINEASSCTVGGSVAGAGNVISGNGLEGISINAAVSTSNLIRGNKIGTQTNGISPLPNTTNGVTILNSASNNQIGGAAGEGNIIAFNLGAGVMVETGTGNAIQANSIFSNGALGIDLAPAGVTANDIGDGDTGANNRQNFPVLTAANGAAGGGVNAQGTLNSNASTTFTLHFYASAACDASGNGEGQTFLGSATTTTNASGNATFSANLAGTAALGQSITATATNPQGNTSEFSACVPYGAADLAIAKTASAPTIIVGSNVTYTVTVTNNGPDTAQSVTVTDNLPSSVIFVSCSSTGGGVCGGSGNNRTVTFASLASGSSATITFVATLNCSVANGVIVGNTATVASAVRDPSNVNNSSTANFTASKPAATLNPTSAAFASDGGSSTVNVTFPEGCGWQAVSNSSFLTITSGSLGTGNGTVAYSVALNSTGSPRTGTLTIAGQTFTVNQSNAPCSYMIAPASNSIPASGGSGSVSVTTQSGCIWKAIPNDSWITVPPDSNGVGNGSFNYNVEANPDSARTGTITIANQVFTVMQAGGGCAFSIAPAGKLFGKLGSEGSLAVMTSAGCGWTASTNESWIIITSEASGTGPGTVTYAVRDNESPSLRQGAITVAGHSFAVIQEGGALGGCSYILNPTSASYNASGGSGTIQINTGEMCAWEATSNVSWITFTSNVVGVNAGSVAYNVAANPGPGGRSGTIRIAGQSFKVKQK